MLPKERIVLDGKLDEAVWSRGQPASGFRQRLPRERQGTEASESTEVRVVYDSDHLYVGAILRDSKASEIVDRQRSRDANLDTDDFFSVAVDPFGDGRGGYLFQTNPSGVLRDALLQSGDTNFAWNGLWDVRTTRTADGWQAEFSLPLRMFDFAPDQSQWAINFRRVLRRDDEESLWTGYLQQQGITRTLYAGTLEGLQNLKQGNNLLFTPYITGVWRKGPDLKDGFDPTTGFDLTYSITPNLRAALTVNTDFAATEVDDRQVNLGRLPLFVPEKRDFFLEGSSVFGFPGPDSTKPYYSRQIGSNDAGPVPIAVGARLAGQVENFDLGLMQVRTQAAYGHDTEDITVARFKARFGDEDYAGLLYTGRSGDLDTDHTIGLDGRIRLLDLGGGQTVTSTPYFIWTTGKATSGDTDWLDSSVLAHEFSWNGNSLHIFNRAMQIGEDFSPAVGFTDGTGVRKYYLWVAYDFDPEWVAGRKFQYGIEFNYRTDLNDRLIEGITWIGPWWQEFDSGDVVENWAYFESFNVDTPFEVWPGIVIPVGEYHRWGTWGQITTSDRRWWSMRTYVRHGGFFNGIRTKVHIETTLRPLPGLEACFFWESHFVDLPQGEFTSRLFRTRLSYSMTTRHSFSVFTQFDNRSNVLGLQARFRWIIRPGSELFLGYLHDWDRTFDEQEGNWRWYARNRETAIKATWSLSF